MTLPGGRPTILILGMCSLPRGTMERQLGNMAILIPTLKLLHQAIPAADIRTSLQLSEGFCEQHGVTSLPLRSLYEPTVRSGIAAAGALILALLWRSVDQVLGVNARLLLRGKRFAEITRADVVLDFSGDTLGDMASFPHLLKHACDLTIVSALRKPLVFFAQSPGPFSSALRRSLGRWILSRGAVVCAREPVARATTRALQVRTPVIGTACPAFLLAPASPEEVEAVLRKENLLAKPRGRLGITLTGFSFSRDLVGKDKYRERRDESEVAPLVEVIGHAIEELDLDVVFIPHVFRTQSDGRLIHGPDSAVTRQVCHMLRERHPERASRMHMVEGCYGAQLTKALIGTCDVYLSGRLHAGVAALSQGIPTVLLAYGRKFLGFSALVGQEALVSEAFAGKVNAQDVKAKLDLAWAGRDRARCEISAAMDGVRQLVDLNVRIVADVLALARQSIAIAPEWMADAWEKESVELLSSIGIRGPV